MFSRRGRGGIRPSQALFANPFQQQIYDKLRDFAESKATELNLEPMTREERKLTHDLVLKLGLRSVGRGEEPSRYMTIMRPRSKDHLSAITKAREVTELRPEQQQAIRAYLQNGIVVVQVPQFVLEEAADNAIPIRTSPQTVLTYCTTGVLLRTLAGDGLAGDVSHLNLDEVHERQQNTDYLLIAVRQILEHHSDLKVILMSATMDGNRETFTSYFAKFDVGHVHIPSRLHNVDTFHLSQVLAMTRYIPKEEEGRVHGDALRQVDRELDQMFPNKPSTFDPQFGIRVKTAQLPEEHLVQAYVVSCSHDVEEGIDADLTLAPIKYCVDSAVCGSILVFLPGNEDILATPRWRRRHSDAGTSVRTSLPDGPRGPTANSTPSGHRKVILSTNIAEASLTIEDVVFVIDCGKTKELTYDCSNRISELNVTQIAKLNAEQRRGRAGRCRNGFCFRLYSSKDFEDMPLAQVAEMKRAAIHDICLHAKIFAPRNMTAKAFLELAPEPPSPEAIEKSLGSLEELGPLSSDSVPQPTGPLVGPRREPAPTKLGRLIARLPLDPQQARMLVFGLVLKCFSPMLTIVSTLSHRDPYQILELALGPVHKPVFTPPLYRCLTVWC